MRWLRVALPLAAVGVLVAQVASAEVPSFVRQTGLTCNQCHMTWTPTPDLTFTGTKFRLNGYRTPWVAEKIEAGEEGSLSGRRLVLGVAGYLSFHMRSLLIAQSKSASDPLGPEPKPNAASTQPFQSLAWDYTGPITEHVGIWTEWYSTQQNPGVLGNEYGPVDNDEYDVKMTFNPGDGGNILSFGINNQSRTSPFFGAFSPGAPSTGQGDKVHVAVTAWLRDRVALSFAVAPGQDDYTYEKMLWGANAAYLLLNTDAMWLIANVSLMTGNDMNPLGNRRGLSSVRLGGGGNYTSDDIGDAFRTLIDVRFGALDRGPWSWNSGTGFVINDEEYTDGAKVKVRSLGTRWRLFYERTYGFNVRLSKYFTYEYTDAAGAVYDIPDDWRWQFYFTWRQAMNFAWEVYYGNSQSYTIGQNWRNGYSWGVRWHFLY